MNIYIKSLKRDVDTGVVKSILWMASKISADGKHRAESKGEKFLVPKSPDDSSFIQYSQIEAETADSWLRDALTPEGISNIEQYLDAMLAQKASQTKQIGNPWSPSFDAVQTETQPAQPMRRTSFPITQS
jgi:hypothetical protein